MHQLSVVIAQKDHSAALRLAHAIGARCRHVAVVQSSIEIHDAILKGQAQALIVDLDLISSEQLRSLCKEFRSTAVVATHNMLDEPMWKQCMDLGAADCFRPSDIEGMLRAILQNVTLARAAHAA